MSSAPESPDSPDELPRELRTARPAGDSGDETGAEPPRYSVEEKVGEGGMGSIYRVVDRDLERTLAMKVGKLRAASDATESAAREARFLAEARVTARLDHPGIVPVHELGIAEDGRTYFTMPLVRGRSLSEVFRLAREGRDDWNLARAIGVLVKVAQTIAYAHSKGVVHRDLKPANVMVGSFGEVYVLDWGLAKLRDEERGTESEDAVLGTPAYMSPEQAGGRAGDVDERSDIYALGALLYELLCGQPPYVAPGARVSSSIVLARVTEGPPRRVREIEASAPAGLSAVCEKAMARDRAARYADALALAEDLQAWLDGRVVGAYRTGTLAELVSWCSRHRALLGSAAAVALVSALVWLAVDGWLTRREAARFLEMGDAATRRLRELEVEVPGLEDRWLAARSSLESFRPVWHRREELERHRELDAARKQLDALFNDAEAFYGQAHGLLGDSGQGLEARRRLEALYFERHEAITRGESIVQSAAYYRRKLEEFDPDAYREKLEAPGRLLLRSDPPGADVYCFRFERNDEERLVPVPFVELSGARGATAAVEPILRVDRIWRAERHQGIFEVGDRLVEIGGRAVRSRGDLAGAIEGLAAGASVSAAVERLGRRVELDWIPFPEDLYARTRTWRPGELIDIQLQLGLTFEGLPLDFRDACRAGVTKSDAPLELVLPRGSYILVLRRSGWTDARYPVVVPWSVETATVRMLRRDEVPDGFVHVPAGPYTFGGDFRAFQSRERGEVELDDYFIARHEVTVEDYLRFLNDEAIAPRIIDGGMEPRRPEVLEEVRRLFGENAGAIPIVPHDPERDAPLVVRDADGVWSISPDYARRLKPTSPVPSVCQLAAREYAWWLSERSERWRFRLPTDDEWEKAARGVDHRSHVWGEYLVRSFCWVGGSRRSSHLPPAVGICPMDESVYGVRDLAGSVEEFTSSKLAPLYATRRGGNWASRDTQNLRVANRNSRYITGQGTDAGFRLVAVPKSFE